MGLWRMCKYEVLLLVIAELLIEGCIANALQYKELAIYAI
jgi:hypothetical protein